MTPRSCANCAHLSPETGKHCAFPMPFWVEPGVFDDPSRHGSGCACWTAKQKPKRERVKA